jgi:predicted metal-binding protein/precorrin-6B methylase 2
MKKLPFMSPDPQDTGPQYLEDLACGYWFSEALFTAVEAELFTRLEPQGKTVDELAGTTGFAVKGLERFLQALCAMGLLTSDGTGDGTRYYNTKLAAEYLVAGKEHYQGDSILWRKYLAQSWQGLAGCLKAGGRVDFGAVDEDAAQRAKRIRRYISAMDRVARTKIQEILPYFAGCETGPGVGLEAGRGVGFNGTGALLDVGAGSGAMAAGILTRFPAMTATLMDLPEVLNYTREVLAERGLAAGEAAVEATASGEAARLTYCPANILEPWPVAAGTFDLVILSNIVHAYAEEEISGVLTKAAACLKLGGLILMHDFFLEHTPEKAALFDLNMFINTYNGKVFPGKWVREELARLGLCTTELIPLATDTALIFAARDEQALAGLSLDPIARLAARIKELGFHHARPVPVDIVEVADWPGLKCQFGCVRFGKPHCPPTGPTPEKTRAVLTGYTKALLLEGEPPTDTFQRQVLKAEKEAFTAGYHKAFAYWAGSCTMCEPCVFGGPGTAGNSSATGSAIACRNTRDARPSMEGAGIDVFETVRRAGFKLRTLREKDEYVKYFALLLLE